MKTDRRKPRKIPRNKALAKGNHFSVYSPQFATIAEEQAKLGKTNAEIAKLLNVTEGTLYRWRNEHPDFREGLQAGKDFYDSDVVEKALLEDAQGHPWEEVTMERGEDGQMREVKRVKKWQRNFQAQRMWLLNRRRERWADRTEVVVSDKDLEAKLLLAEQRLKEAMNGQAGASGNERCAEVESPCGREAGEPALSGAGDVE